MNSKSFIQLFFLIILLIIVGIFYYKFIDNFSPINEKEQVNKTKIEDNNKSNIIKDIAYESLDQNGNKYVIKSSIGEINEKKLDEIKMKNVIAEIRLKNGDLIAIQSDWALYNNLTYNTNFYDNVDMKYLLHHITTNKLDIFFDKNYLQAYENLVYKNENFIMTADKAEIDLITKDTKIYMDKEKKVKIINR